MTLALALAAELAGWLARVPNATQTYGWPLVQENLGPGGFALAFAAGLALVAWRSRWLPPAWVGVLLVHAAFWDVAQAQPDAAAWFTLAQRVARAPVEVLTAWPSHAWVGEEANFHKPFPLVPAVYGFAFLLVGESARVASLVMAAWALALSAVVPWVARAVGPSSASDESHARLAGWLVVAFPYLQAQSGWLLADLPLCVTVALAWGAIVRVRRPVHLLWAIPAVLPAVATKVTGLWFVAFPALALALPLPAFVGTVALGGLALLAVHPPRLRPVDAYLSGLSSLALHLRSAAWIGALSSLWSDNRAGRLLLGALVTVPPVIAYSPVEHLPRYLLPVGVALAVALPHTSPALARFLVGSGLVLLLGGYAPIARHHPASHLQEAARAMVARGASAIEVVADGPGNTVPAAGLAALVDLYAPIPVRTGANLREGAPKGKRRWWRYTEPPPWRSAGDADGLLLCLYASDPASFEAAHPEWRRVGGVTGDGAPTTLAPRWVVFYER
jgi:hypothetical protein